MGAEAGNVDAFREYLRRWMDGIGVEKNSRYGMALLQTKSLRTQLREVTGAVLKISTSGSEIPEVVESIDLTLKKNDHDDLGPEEVKKLLDALSKIELPKNKKAVLSNLTRLVCDDWKVGIADIESLRNSNGGRKRIGTGVAANVLLANMRLRDEKDSIISGGLIEVAVKEFVVRSSEAKENFPLFLHKVFLQKDAVHPCIIRTFGGHWPDREQAQKKDEIKPVIVMERMTHNLRQARQNQFLDSLESKRRVLADIASGIEYLHSQGIGHGVIRPENVLMLIVDNQIVSRAKVSHSGVSRIARQTDSMITAMQEPAVHAKTLAYVPPEAFAASA